MVNAFVIDSSNLTKDICSARRLLNENAVLQTSFTSPDGDVCVVDTDDEVTVRVEFQGEIKRFGMNTVSELQHM